jgi:lysophospholipase L1-like esterase
MKRLLFLFLTVTVLAGAGTTLTAQNQTPAAPTAPIKIACVGNSITYGYGIEGRDSLSYPARLQQMIGDKFIVHNYGVSGRTLLKKGDHPYWNEDAYQQARGWQPDLVIIMLGTNDTKEQNWKYSSEFESDYRELLESFKNLPSHPTVFASLPVPVFQTKYGIRDSVLKLEFPMIKKASRREGVHVINLYKAMKPYGKDFFDGVHPDKTGAYFLARAVLQGIRNYRPPSRR